MEIPVVVTLDVERLLTLPEMGELLYDLGTIYSASAQAATQDPSQAAEVRIYVTEIRSGSVWIELIASSGNAEVTAIVATFVAVVSGSPWLAALPHTVRERWYRAAARAEEARQAYERSLRKGNMSAAQGSMSDIHGRSRTRRRPRQRRSTGTVDTP